MFSKIPREKLTLKKISSLVYISNNQLEHVMGNKAHLINYSGKMNKILGGAEPNTISYSTE